MLTAASTDAQHKVRQQVMDIINRHPEIAVQEVDLGPGAQVFHVLGSACTQRVHALDELAAELNHPRPTVTGGGTEYSTIRDGVILWTEYERTVPR